MLISTVKQGVLLAVLAGVPVIWFRVNGIEKVLELIRLGQFAEIVKLIKQPERVLRFFFSSGVACVLGGAAYLSLPLKFFIGWIPFVGRIDDFVAKSFVTGGLLAFAAGAAVQYHFFS